MEEPTHQRPGGAELLFCFDGGPSPTTLAQHEPKSGSTSCFHWAANTNRHPDLEPSLNRQQQLQRHLIRMVLYNYTPL